MSDISRVGHHSRHLLLSYTEASIQGIYAGEVGSMRLLKLFERYKIKTTWFIPGLPLIQLIATAYMLNLTTGHSLETFPEQMAAVRDAGHEMQVIFRTCI